MPKVFLSGCILFATSSLFFASEDTGPDALIRAGHFKRARTILDSTLKQNPKDSNALRQMARVKLAFADSEGAMKLAEEATAADNRDSHAHCLLAELVAGKIDTAGMFEKMRLAPRIKTEAEAGIALDPKNTDCLEVLVAFHLQAPGIVGGDKKKADDYLRRMMDADPVVGDRVQAEQAIEKKQWSQAEAAYRAALTADSKSYGANADLGAFCAGDHGGKRYDLAERFREAIRLDPKRSQAYSSLVQVLLSQEKNSEADALLVSAEKNVPDDLNPYYQAGRVLLNLNRNLSQAESYFRKYITQDETEGAAPTIAHAHWRLGLVLEKEGKRPEALAEMETALRLKPDLKAAEADRKRLKG